MPARPVVAGFKLEDADEHLMEYWLGRRADLRRWTAGEILRPGELARGLNYFPHATLALIQKFAKWYVPVLVVSRASGEDRSRLRKTLLECGLAALWEPGAPPESLVFPELDPVRRPPVFIVSDDSRQVSLYRQILYFSGRDSRADFRTPGELIAALFESKDSERYPELLIVDLDTRAMDPLGLFHELRRFLRANPGRTSDTRLLLTKDFSVPGLDLATVESTLRPLARRIFHPNEAICVLLEAFHLPQPAAGSAPAFRPRDLDALLYSADVRRLITKPPPLPQKSVGAFPALRWLYDWLGESPAEGALLTRLTPEEERLRPGAGV